MVDTPLLDTIEDPADLRRLPRRRAAPARRRAAPGDDRCGVRDRRASGRRSRRGRADGGPALRVRHAARQDRLGCRPSGVSAQDPDRAARPHPDAASAGRAVRLHQALGKPVRSVRRRAQLDLDLGRARHGHRARSGGRRFPRGGGDRRWRDERRHGLRGDEQRRRHERAPDRDPQRQRHVDRARDRRDARLPVARDLVAVVHDLPARRQAARRVRAAAARRGGREGRGVRARHDDRRHPVRGAGVLLHRPARWPQHRPPAAGAQERARRQAAGTGPDPRAHAQGRRVSAGGELGRQVPRRGQVRHRDRRPVQEADAPRPPTPRCSPRR